MCELTNHLHHLPVENRLIFLNAIRHACSACFARECRNRPDSMNLLYDSRRKKLPAQHLAGLCLLVHTPCQVHPSFRCACFHCRIIYPENHERLPQHLSITARLLASPHALNRIRTAVQGRLAFLVPGVVQEQDMDLAVQLGIPMMSSPSSVSEALGRKSSARQVAEGCKL